MLDDRSEYVCNYTVSAFGHLGEPAYKAIRRELDSGTITRKQWKTRHRMERILYHAELKKKRSLT